MFNRNKLAIVAGLAQHDNIDPYISHDLKLIRNLFQDANELYSYLGAVGRKTKSFGNNDVMSVEELADSIRMNLLS